MNLPGLPRTLAGRALVCALVIGVAGPLTAMEVPPPRSVTLFPAGIGEFVHLVDVDGAAELELVVDREQMPDVIRTLTVRDPAGSPSGAFFASGEPIARRLARMRFDLSDVADLADLLVQARGAAIRLETQERGTISGELIAVDADRITVALEGGVSEVAREAVLSVAFVDAQLDAHFRRALAALGAGAAGDGRRRITIQLAPGGNRTVVLRYLRPNPAWRVSYRAVVDSEAGRMRLQGWAHLDNTGALDWREVDLAFVSAQPQTLDVDLYTPSYPGREPARPAARAGRLESMAFDMESAAEGPPTGSAIGAEELPEGFVFRMPQPVTIEAGAAAMVPLVDREVTATRVRAFDPRRDRGEPRAALRIENDTQLQLPPGPLAVYEAGRFAGDVMLPLLVPGQRTSTAFATDPDLTVAVDRGGETSEIRTVTIVDGVLVSERRARRIIEYRIDWRVAAGERRTGPPLVITHRVAPGWTLTSPPATPDADNTVDFTVTGTRLVVTEEQIREQRVALSAVATEELLAFADNRLLDPTTRRIVRNVAELRRELARREEQRARLERDREALVTDQARIRENMGPLSRTSSLYQRYEQELEQSEDRLAIVSEDLAEAREAEDAARSALREYLRTLQP